MENIDGEINSTRNYGLLLLFGEKGYTATTIREVAEKAGVSELTIFRNFKNKENLLGRVLFYGRHQLLC